MCHAYIYIYESSQDDLCIMLLERWLARNHKSTTPSTVMECSTDCITQNSTFNVKKIFQIHVHKNTLV